MSRNFSRKEVEYEQLLRYNRYPKNRIPFLSYPTAASEDQKNFRRFAQGELTLSTLCELTRVNNLLPHVDERAMVHELINTGWADREWIFCIEPTTHDVVAMYPSCREAERQTGINGDNIGRVVRGERWTAGKFIWVRGEEL